METGTDKEIYASKDNSEYTGLFVILAMLFITCFLVSNVIGGKMWAIGEHTSLPASVILFPLTYMLADVFTEVYGFERTRRVIWTGFACNVVAVLAYMITIILPHPLYWLEESAFAVVLGMAPRMILASLTAYLIGEFSNSILLSKIKIKTNGKYLWVRTIGSSLVGEGLDSVIFILVAFAGTIPSDKLLSTILFQYLFKLGYEIVLTPLTYWVVGSLKRKEGIDIYDYEQKYKIL